jgi:hypothetical protein
MAFGAHNHSNKEIIAIVNFRLKQQQQRVTEQKVN